MQTQPQKSSAIRFGSAVLYADGLNLGLLDNAKVQIDWNTIDIRAHNGRLPVKRRPSRVFISAELYEVDLTNISLIDGHGVLSNWGSTTDVTVTAELVLEAGQIIDKTKIYWLANQSSLGLVTTVSAASVNNASALSDFTIVKDHGKVGLQYKGAVTTATTHNTTVTYTYQKAATKRLTISDLAKIVTYCELKFVNTDQATGKTFTITIPKGYLSNSQALNFVSDEAEDEVMKVPFEFDAYPDESNQLIIIEDEQSVTA